MFLLNLQLGKGSAGKASLCSMQPESAGTASRRGGGREPLRREHTHFLAGKVVHLSASFTGVSPWGGWLLKNKCFKRQSRSGQFLQAWTQTMVLCHFFCILLAKSREKSQLPALDVRCAEKFGSHVTNPPHLI